MMADKIRVGMVSLGCPKNQVDAEILLGFLKNAGFELVGDAALADAVVINTCGFIESAKQEAIENILEFCQLKQEGRIKCVAVTGCLAERYRDEIAQEIPEADVILGIGSNTEIADAIRRALEGEKVVRSDVKEKLPLCGERVLTTLPFYAYLKISEGCSNCCSYCAIPSIRGPMRSRKIEDVLAEARWLAERGVKELVLVAQDTTRYGEDLYGESRLPQLLDALCEIDGFRWIRMLYCYPERITDELIDTIARQPKVVKYIDMPIQHVNTDVLRAMNRRSDEASLLSLIAKLRERIPGVVLRTTLITGFPGETDAQFEQLHAFVKQVLFDRLGCFAYSAEEGTRAAQMPNQIDEDIKARRAELIMEEQASIMFTENEKKIGQTLEVVVEGYDRYAESFFGRSAADAPEIDGKIFFKSEQKRALGEFVQVRIDDVLDYDLIGTYVGAVPGRNTSCDSGIE